jgi:sugar phosphate isomerase/epimerase
VRAEAGGPLLDLLAAAISTLGLTVAAHLAFKALDPNRAAREAAVKRKKEIARRLGRPNITTNAYEVGACTAANSPWPTACGKAPGFQSKAFNPCTGTEMM